MGEKGTGGVRSVTCSAASLHGQWQFHGVPSWDVFVVTTLGWLLISMLVSALAAGTPTPTVVLLKKKKNKPLGACSCWAATWVRRTFASCSASRWVGVEWPREPGASPPSYRNASFIEDLASAAASLGGAPLGLNPSWPGLLHPRQGDHWGPLGWHPCSCAVGQGWLGEVLRWSLSFLPACDRNRARCELSAWRKLSLGRSPSCCREAPPLRGFSG